MIGIGLALPQVRGVAAAFSPSDRATLKFWFEADGRLYQDSGRTTPAVADSDPVGDWDDRSASAFHAAQATAGQRPLLKTNVLNGKPGVLFDGVDDNLLRAAGATGVQTLFVVFKKTTSANWVNFPGLVNSHGAASSDQWCFGYSATKRVGTNGGLGAQVYVDGVAGAGPEWGDFTPLDSPHVYEVTATGFTGTGLYLGYLGGQLFAGYLFAAIGYGDLLNSTDRGLVRTYLRSAPRWGF